ncbi:MAG: glycosyltransferase family 39 protein [Thermoanaerobaculia bacterium]
MGRRRKTARSRRGRPKAASLHPVEREAAPPETASRAGLRRFAFPLILAVSAAAQVATMAMHRIHWNSDQAIVALMARHIQTGQAHPIFYYGSHYAGTLESHYLAAVFTLFGSSFASYRLGMMLLLLLHSVLVYAVARRAFGVTAGLAAAAYLAIPPYFYLYKGLTSDGAYTSLAVLGAGMLYAAVRLEDAQSSGAKRASLGWAALLGVLAGLAWWVLPLAGYFYVAILLWFLAVARSVFRRPGNYLVFLAAVLLGSLPWWLGNLGQGWPSFTAPGISLIRSDRVFLGLADFFRRGVPALFGAHPAPVHPDIFPGASIVAALICVLPLGFSLHVLLSPKRRRKEPARRALLLAVLMFFSIPLVAGLNEETYLFDPRYVYPIYAPFALLLGYASTRGPLGRRALLGLAAGALVFNTVSILRAPRVPVSFAQPSGAALDRVIDALRERGFREAYASYWMAYSLAFQSREEIAVASFGTGTHGTARWPGYLARVAGSDNPAFVLWGEEAAKLETYLKRRGARAKTAEVEGYRIFWDVPAEVRRELAALRYVPDAAGAP